MIGTSRKPGLRPCCARGSRCAAKVGASVYGLRKNTDLKFLNGREVGQIAIGLYQIQFGFDEDVRISVEGEFRWFEGGNEVVWRPEPGSAQIAARMVALLGADDRNL
jgi:hypothetical protein